MKKITSVILSLLIMCSLAACGRSSVDSVPNISEKDTIQNTTAPAFQTATIPATLPEMASPTEAIPPATTEGAKENKTNNSIGAEFKAAMDSYEAFFDEYVAIMKKYKDNPMDISILADYADYMGQYADMMQKFEKWENEDLNEAELAYYIDVQARITKKLLEVA